MIIGLVGFAGSGKDTVGDILSNQGFKRESFAKPVKDAVAAIFGWDRGQLEGTTKADREWREMPCPYWSEKFGKKFTPRMALQLMGTEIGREIYHPNLWVDALERRITAPYPRREKRNWVITDVRFINEMEMIHRLDGVIVQINRGPRPPWYHDAVDYNVNRLISPYPIPSTLQNIHISEWGWIGSLLIDHQINNNGTLDELTRQINEILAIARQRIDS